MIDRVELLAEAGGGGDGAISFRRERFVPRGGPDGGDGGRGGDVCLILDRHMRTLAGFRGRKVLAAGRGENGHGKKMHGASGDTIFVGVPAGTGAYRRDESGQWQLLGEVTGPGDKVIVARGGAGGRGNVHFATSTEQAPRVMERGEPGEAVKLVLELKLIADVGIIGLPNAGKSSLLAAMTAAHPKIAEYPFTTLEANLGVAYVDNDELVLADIPGLIEGAHAGYGLGIDFLRHVERTRVLLHLLDGTSENLKGDFEKINVEMGLYKESLLAKPQVAVVNKIDLPQVSENLSAHPDHLAGLPQPIFMVSALTHEGVPELLAWLTARVKSFELPQEEKAERPILHPEAVDERVRVYREGDLIVIAGREVERVMRRLDWGQRDARRVIMSRLARLGVIKELQRAGVKDGDRVRLGGIEVTWE
ncbi:MAG: GTPase ObgE [Chloroflexi bacterium]|nr:GTPase ObgE [Chloroflexota bacterium]